MFAWLRKSVGNSLLLHLLTALPLVFLLGLGWPWAGNAATPPLSLQSVVESGRLTLGAGESSIVGVTDVTRVAVAEPKIADVAVVGKNEVLVSARTAGDTTLHVWDKNGLTSVSVRVTENNADMVSELRTRIGLPGVEPWIRQGTVVLEGWVQTPAEKQRATQVAAAYGKVVDLLAIRPLLPEPVKAQAANDDERLAQVRTLMGEPGLNLQVVKDTLLISGITSDVQRQERARKIGALYYAQVVDVSEVRGNVEQGYWPVEVFRTVDKAVVQVDK